MFFICDIEAARLAFGPARGQSSGWQGDAGFYLVVQRRVVAFIFQFDAGESA